MRYAPHRLEKKISKVERNEYGEVTSSKESWSDMGECRCDDNTTLHVQTENGSYYTPKYHIVCDKCDISEGDEVRVTDKSDGGYRGGGKVFNAPKCNFLGYMSIYV